MRIRPVLASLVLLCSLAPALSAATTREVLRTTPEEKDAIKAAWRAAAAVHDRAPNLAPRFHDIDYCILPAVLVDTTRPTGVTTLYGVINQADELTEGVDNSFFVDVYDVFHEVLYEEELILEPAVAHTRNLRDVLDPADADLDGMVRGFASVEGPGLSCDYYQVDPGNDFALGDVMFTPEDRCFEADVRYGTGGPFDDSEYVILLDQPAGVGEPDVLLEVYTEGGVLDDFAFFSLVPDGAFAEQGSLLTLFGDLGLFPPPFGYLVVSFNPITNGGYLAIRVFADSRYSVGLPQTCREPAGPVPVR